MRLRWMKKIIFLGLGVVLLASFGRFSQRDFNTKEFSLKGLQASVLSNPNDHTIGNSLFNYIPLVIQKLVYGLRESALKSMTAGFANAPVLIEELLPKGRRFSAPVRGGKFLATNWIDSSLDPALKDRDCAELPVQKEVSSRPVENTQGPYFFSVDISKLTLANQPCLHLQIEDTTVSAMLDLGFRGQFGLSDRFLKTVKDKKYLQSTTMYGVRGNQYEQKLYEIPRIQVGPVSFSSSIVHEYSETFHKDATLLKKSEEISSPEPAKIGWELFGNTNLFLDLEHSKIAFCDSINTLKDQGYELVNFTQTPLLLERGLVECIAATSDGPLRCVLDTGATWNILNREIEEGKSLDQIVQDPNYITNYTSFSIDKNEFGPIDFLRIPIKIPIHIEASPYTMEGLTEALVRGL